MLALRGWQSGESTPELLNVRRNPLLMHFGPNSGWPQAWSAHFASLYWRCVTDRRKFRSLGSLRVANVTKSAICNEKLIIYLTYPSPFGLVGHDLQAKDDAQENADLVKASLKVRVDSLLSNAFNHRVHNKHLGAAEGIR